MLRQARPTDYQAIEAVAHAIWGDDEAARAKRPPGWDRRRWTVDAHMSDGKVPVPTTMVKDLDGRIVAVGSVRIRQQAPRNDIYIHVAPSVRGEGIGTELYEALDAANDAGPYMNRDFGDPQMVDLFESLGFQVVERVTEGWIHPEQPTTAAWIDGILAASSDNISVIPLGYSEVPSPVEVARLYDRFYQRAHFYLSDTPRSDSEALDFFLGTALFHAPPLRSFCAIDDGQLVGAASLGPAVFGNGDPLSANLVWVVAEASDPAKAESVVAILVASVLGEARRLGLRVQVEASTLAPRLLACVSSIPGGDLDSGLTVLVSDRPAMG